MDFSLCHLGNQFLVEQYFQNTKYFLLHSQLWQLILIKCLLSDFSTVTLAFRVEWSFFLLEPDKNSLTSWKWAHAWKIPFLLTATCPFASISSSLFPFLWCQNSLYTFLKCRFLKKNFSGHKGDFKTRGHFFRLILRFMLADKPLQRVTVLFTLLWAHEWPSSSRSPRQQPWPSLAGFLPKKHQHWSFCCYFCGLIVKHASYCTEQMFSKDIIVYVKKANQSHFRKGGGSRECNMFPFAFSLS